MALEELMLITPQINGEEMAFVQHIKAAYDNGIKLIQFRNHNLEQNQYLQLAETILDVMNGTSLKLILNTPIDVLKLLPKVAGLHLSSHRAACLKSRPVNSDYLLSIACHDLAQLHHAEKIEADCALLSPIHTTPSCPTHQAIGWQGFADMVQDITIPVYALGGLTAKDLPCAKSLGAKGIAGIRGFWSSN